MLDSLGPFQKSVIYVAIFVMIVLLAIIGYILNQSNFGFVYPPKPSNCPDYWSEGSDGTCIQTIKLPGVVCSDYDAIVGKSPSRTVYPTESACPYKNTQQAMEACKLTWNGITNVDWDSNTCLNISAA